jgi:hypothetical protein
MTTQFAALTVNVDASEVRPGDDLVFLGTPHHIVAIKPYVSDGHYVERSRWRIAVDAFGWGLTLIPGDRFEVIR